MAQGGWPDSRNIPLIALLLAGGTDKWQQCWERIIHLDYLLRNYRWSNQ